MENQYVCFRPRNGEVILKTKNEEWIWQKKKRFSPSNGFQSPQWGVKK